jgi:hypothetical protein
VVLPRRKFPNKKNLKMPRHLMKIFCFLLIDGDQGVRETRVHDITMG